MPLAVVTGRPRSPDCDRFLADHDIGQYFSAVVCMEDGPAKPDPCVVRMAMDQLQVTRAYMIGDTPDDINAATAAGIPGLGICAPGEANPATLEKHKPARVIESLEELRGFLC
jgi:phosphoglycolate phosphatase-like HAD superfamily hydrolase